MKRTWTYIVMACLIALSTMGAFAAEREPVTLHFWNGWGGDRIPLMEKMIADFEALHPWITVENTLIGLGNDRIEKLLLSVGAGAPPDVAMVDRADIPLFVRNGALLPIDDFMAADGVNPDAFYEPEIGSAQYNGETWGLPLPTAGAKQLLFYNVDLLHEAGLAESHIPNTWTDLTDVARKMTRYHADGSLAHLGFNPLRVPDSGWDFWLFNNGSQLLTEDGRTLTLHTERTVDTLQWLDDYVNTIGGSYADFQAFSDSLPGLTATMELGGSWRWFEWKREVEGINLGIALAPAGPHGQPLNLVDRGWSYAIPQGAPHPYESWLLIKYMTTHPDAACWFMEQQGRPSPLQACNLNPALFEANPYMDVIGEALMNAVQIPITPIHSELFSEIRQVSGRVLQGESVTSVLEDFQRRLQIKLDEAWAEN